MKRRRFIQTVAGAPVVPGLVARQAAAQTTAQSGAAPAPQATTRAYTAADPVTRFFTSVQLATLRKLCEILMPPMNGNPGALDAGVPEFLDFLISESSAERKQLYRTGLDLMNTRAMKQSGKAFSSLDAKQADAVIRPLLVVVPWAYDPPKDPGSHFLTAAHEDIRTATRNSREWGAAAAAAGRRGSGAQQYWNPVDPTYKG